MCLQSLEMQCSKVVTSNVEISPVDVREVEVTSYPEYVMWIR